MYQLASDEQYRWQMCHPIERVRPPRMMLGKGEGLEVFTWLQVQRWSLTDYQGDGNASDGDVERTHDVKGFEKLENLNRPAVDVQELWRKGEAGRARFRPCRFIPARSQRR